MVLRGSLRRMKKMRRKKIRMGRRVRKKSLAPTKFGKIR